MRSNSYLKKPTRSAMREARRAIARKKKNADRIILDTRDIKEAKRYFASHPKVNLYSIIPKNAEPITDQNRDNSIQFCKLPNGKIFVVKGKSLGEGSSGSVHRARMLGSSKYFVVKKYHNRDDIEGPKWEAEKLKIKTAKKADAEFRRYHRFLKISRLNDDGTTINEGWVLTKELLDPDGNEFVRPKKVYEGNIKVGPSPEKTGSMRTLFVNPDSLPGDHGKEWLAQEGEISIQPAEVYEENYRKLTADEVLDKSTSHQRVLLGVGTKFKRFNKFSWEPTPYVNIAAVKIPTDERNVFLNNFFTLLEISESLCEDDKVLLDQGYVDMDSKLSNVKIAKIKKNLQERVLSAFRKTRTKYTTMPMDAGEVIKLSEVDEKLLNATMPHGTMGFLSQYNEAVYYHIHNKDQIPKIIAARNWLAARKVLIERMHRGEINSLPESMQESEMVKAMQEIATLPKYKINAESAAAATGAMMEYLTRRDFKYLPFSGETGEGLPSGLYSTTNDPYVALLNQFVKITKKMRNPELEHGYTAINALEDFAVLKQKIKAMIRVEKDLEKPVGYSITSPMRRFATHIKPYVGANLKTTASSDREIKNVVKSLAIELDPRKYFISTNASHCVNIKEVASKKTVSSLEIIGATDSDKKFVQSKLSEDQELIANTLLATVALAEKGEPIVLSDCAHNPEYALKVKKTAETLSARDGVAIKLNFDPATEAAVQEFLKANPKHPLSPKPAAGPS